MKPKNIRMPDPLYDEIVKAAEHEHMSINKYIIKCLEDNLGGEISISERLNKIEQYVIELQWQVAVQSTYTRELSRVLFTRIDKPKGTPEDIKTKVMQAMSDVQKLAQKSVASVNNNEDIWYVSGQEEPTSQTE